VNERIAVLLVAMLLELLGGLGLRNESTAARGRIEVERRCQLECSQRINACRSLYDELTAPANLQRLMDERKRAAETANLPRL
jgi:hypothetical protein